MISAPATIKIEHGIALQAAPRTRDKQTLLKPLHGLRGWFALTVFLYHAWTDNLLFNTATAFAVQGFFCLSGFILAYVYQHNLLQRLKLRDFLNFVWNRFSRLIPLYYVTTVASLTLISIARKTGYRFNHDWDTSPFVILWNFLACDVFAYRVGGPQISYPYDRWSVSVEIWLYLLLFPLLAWLYTKMKGQRRFAQVGFACALAIAIMTSFWYIHLGQGEARELFGRGISYFTIGFFIFALRLRPLSRRAHYSLVALLILSGAAFCLLSSPMTLMPVPAALLILIFAYSRPEEPLCRWLSNRPSIFLGDISYSLYLWHATFLLALGFFRRKLLNLGSLHYDVLFMVIFTIPLILFASWLSYKFIEIPARRWLRNLRTSPGGSVSP